MTPRDLDEAVLWACRLLLNLEPTDPSTVVPQPPAEARTWGDVRTWALATPAYRDRFRETGSVRPDPAEPVDLHRGILWAYRFYLLREPAGGELERDASKVASITEIRMRFLLSREFELMGGRGILDLRDAAIINRFAPFCEDPAPDGSFHDFLGTRTRLGYLPEGHARKSGTVDGAPRSARPGLHGASEWIGTLRSVVEARERLVAVELGAGWAPWLVAAAFAARKVGIDDVTLIGVEGSADHLAFAHQHFADNGLDPAAHRLINAVAGIEDGVARFPRLIEPREHYGARAAFRVGEDEDGPGLGAWEEIRSVSLATLLGDIDHVDVMHVDIQGSEAEVLRSGIATLNGKVRRVVVGTHGRAIEDELFALFSSAGWRLEAEKACTLVQEPSGAVILRADGEQVWGNQALKRPRRGVARLLEGALRFGRSLSNRPDA